MDYEAEFSRRLKGLNAQQRQAVDIISGPLMVVAGPGTGKTELLAVRAANILHQTDADPSNILCLTFTDSGSANMVKRLAQIIGSTAYQVEIQTFHSFGSAIIGRFGEYFYSGAGYQPADQLTQAEILTEIIAGLSYDNPLATLNPSGQPIYLKTIQKLISDFKNSGLNPDQLEELVDQDLSFSTDIEPTINEVFTKGISKKTISKCDDLLVELRRLATQTPPLAQAITPTLAQIMANDLAEAYAAAGDDGSTKPITAFKNRWVGNSDNGTKTLKITEHCRKLKLALDIYRQYLAKMDERQLYDFNDMILRVIQAITEHPGLKATLQEQYQYVMVDEFQDTNEAQMRLLHLLTDYDDQPNLMVVGDDDQAIYRFQGADIGNIQTFTRRYPKLRQVNLQTNYRSGTAIIKLAEQVAGDITERLTNADGTPKRLVAHHSDYKCRIDWTVATSQAGEFSHVAGSIKRAIDQGAKPAQIAVIARRHKSLVQLADFLTALNIPFTYQHQQNVFDSELIKLLLNLARAIVCIAHNNITDANAYLPHIIASPAFGISGEEFYQISLDTEAQWGNWFKAIAKRQPRLIGWLKEQAQRSLDSPLEVMCAELMGITGMPNDEDDWETGRPDDSVSLAEKKYRSPIYRYYFGADKLEQDSLAYLNFLGDYTTLSQALEQYRPDRKNTLNDLLKFADRYQALNESLSSVATYGTAEGVQLMTAHKAKGLEFDTVYLIDAESEEWGSKCREKNAMIKLPPNLPLDNAGTTDDEKRRLFFVAITRAMRQLHLSSHSGQGSKELNQLEYALDYIPATSLDEPDMPETAKELVTSAFSFLLDSSLDRKSLLADRLSSYSLSASDLNAFTDLTYGGPERFLLDRLLRLPGVQTVNQLFGTAIHAVMQSLHNYAGSEDHPGKLPPIEQTYQVFQTSFRTTSLDEATTRKWSAKGRAIIDAYYEKRSESFRPNQRAELRLEATISDGVRLNGKLDAVELDSHKRQAIITDYKTGKSFPSFSSINKDSIHAYANQLMFYKLLFESSNQYHDWQVTEGVIEFVVPDPKTRQLIAPVFDYGRLADMAEFTKLVQAVYRRIVSLDFPDVSKFARSLTGTKQFERWLIEHD